MSAPQSQATIGSDRRYHGDPAPQPVTDDTTIATDMQDLAAADFIQRRAERFMAGGE